MVAQASESSRSELLENVDVGPASNLSARLRHAAASGGRVGLATGGIATLADCISVLSFRREGGTMMLLLATASVVVPTLTLIGAAGALWLQFIGRRAETTHRRFEPWRWGALAFLPLAWGALWVPWGWVTSHWGSLSMPQKGLAVAIYPCALAAFCFLGRVTFYARQRYASGHGTPWFHWPLVLASTAAMISFYWVDRTYYTDDYQDFHYGAAGVFLASAAATTLLLRESWRRRATGRPRSTPPSSATLTLSSAALLAFFVLSAMELLSVKSAKALIYRKATHSLQAWADLDGDGYSTILGSADCAPFDGKRSPGQVDLPGDGLDDDCSGSDASRWPERAPVAGYEIPDAQGFNLLLITVDTLRADHLGAYGYPRKTSPNIDRLAKQSLQFTSAFAQSTKTHESIPSLFSGLYPANVPRNRKHPRTIGKKPYVYTMGEEVTLLTERLEQRGYHTYASQILWLLYTLGLDRGFDAYETAEGTTAPVLESATAPFFVWLHYFEPHDPYVLHPGFDFGPKDIDRYDSEIAKVDSLIGQVLARLEANNLEHNTVVVLTSDHGEEFREHGGTSHTSKLQWESLHVPLIMKIPGMAPERLDEIVELVDVLPSLNEAMRLNFPAESFDGQSLWATRAGKRDTGFGFRGAFSETDLQKGFFFRQSVVTRDYRFNLNVDKHDVELFDLRTDPREQINIASIRPDVVRELWNELALRPYRDLGPHLVRAKHGDVRGLVAMLPRIRNERVLGHALSLLARHPAPNVSLAVEAVRKRPDLSAAFRQQLNELFASNH